MFGLIRRLSHSVIPRPDRPWEDDPTSNAPHKARKRRLSASEQDDASFGAPSASSTSGKNATYSGETASKRARGENVASSSTDVDEFGSWSASQQLHQQDQTHDIIRHEEANQQSKEEQAPETQDVKEVTQGVKEVELEEKRGNHDNQEGKHASISTEDAVVNPESVPLPDEDEEGELDEGSAAGSVADSVESSVNSESPEASSNADDVEKSEQEQGKTATQPDDKQESEDAGVR
ncbi:hypothetical protein AMATHDRAFT_1105 [Amanita thiersii Skay4041]|uniref:Uncharacterized protein n=1 Tax=Amanita thiersii Skay4041 TaxID=703135 RepID=A0A2A9NY63_9AGAR|nr:hypothetical protein AMATHDRAFT_1105 [Amanita thiersii Skay4041]